jgi:hypothetical protein
VAGVVFAGGMVILPTIESPPPPPGVPPAPVDGPLPVAAPTVAATDGAGAAEASARGPSEADNGADDEAEAAIAEPSQGLAERPVRQAPVPRVKTADVAPAADKKGEKPTDRDAAREAWRKNLPDVSEDETKGAILIPIKGSIEGASYHVISKPRGLMLNLPHAETLITMRFYKLKRGGFRQLWIKQESAGGTSLKLVLGDATEPQVELKEEFVRVTVRRLPEGQATDPTE